MKLCKICKKKPLRYTLMGKFVCTHCDELTFDLEIECEEEFEAQKPKAPARRNPKQPLRKAN